MKQQISIKVITNDGDRNKDFIPIFHSLNSQGYGKLTDNYYIVNSTVNIGQETKENLLFTLINNKSAMSGHNFVMYQIN